MNIYWDSLENLENLSVKELLNILEEERRNLKKNNGYPEFLHGETIDQAKRVNVGFVHRVLRKKLGQLGYPLQERWPSAE